MSYWIKHFVDAKNEIGKDVDVRHGNASWSKGRLEGITAATLSYAGTVVVVSGLDIWQKDKYAGAMGLPPARFSRSLGVKITPNDVGKKLYLYDSDNLEGYRLEMTEGVAVGNYTIIKSKHVGQWAVVTIGRNGVPSVAIEERYRV